ncbi:MAG: DUF547 domain-containing protein [bacterium]
MKTKILIILLFTFSILSNAQSSEEFFKKADSFFKTYVSKGSVDYKKINADQSSLNELLTLAEGLNISKNNANEYQAFWINAYNLSVIKGIIDNYPINSPLDKSGFFDKTTYALGGKKITLNDIENKLLRAQFNDARVHFVLVCGAVGCPPLISQAYTPESLDKQLNEQTTKALNNPSFIKIKKKKVELSEIFKWYREDFVQNGNEIDFINAFRTTPLDTKSKISYYNYNWSLNALN